MPDLQGHSCKGEESTEAEFHFARKFLVLFAVTGIGSSIYSMT